MKFIYALIAVMPALVAGQDGAGVPDPFADIEDNPTLTVPAHATMTTSPSASVPTSVAAATSVAAIQNHTETHNDTAINSTNITSSFGFPLTGNNASIGLPIGLNGTTGNGTNSSHSGAMEMYAGAHTWPIAGLVAAAGAVGAMML